MWLFLWDTTPSKIFVGDTPISKVFLWSTQVRPAVWPWWTPTAHTIGYRELNGNGEDTKNDYWVTTYTVTDYDAIGYYWTWLPSYVSWRRWKQCASFDWTRALKLPALPVPNVITISAWVNYTSADSTANWASIFQLKMDWASGNTIERNSWSVYFRIQDGDTLAPFFVYWTSGSNATGAYSFSGTILSTGEWHNVVFTFNAWTAKYYIDWVLQDSHTVSWQYLRSQWATASNIWGTLDISDYDQRWVYLTGLIQDVIYENTVWSDSDVASYYANY